MTESELFVHEWYWNCVLFFLDRCIKTAARRQLAKGHEQNGADPNKKASVATQAAPRPSSKDENQLDLERSHSPCTS